MRLWIYCYQTGAILHYTHAWWVSAVEESVFYPVHFSRLLARAEKKFISSKIVKRGEKERKLGSYFRKFCSYFLKHIRPSFIAPARWTVRLAWQHFLILKDSIPFPVPSYHIMMKLVNNKIGYPGWGLSLFSSELQRICRNITSNLTTIASFHVFYDSTFY